MRAVMGLKGVGGRCATVERIIGVTGSRRSQVSLVIGAWLRMEPAQARRMGGMK